MAVIGLGLLLLLTGCGDRHGTLAEGGSVGIGADGLAVSTQAEARSAPAVADPAVTDPAATPTRADTAPERVHPTTLVSAAQFATVHGVVTRAGEAASDVHVTLVADDRTERATTSDGAGAYQFSAVPPGTYELLAYAESGATCDSAGCISASWAERAELTVAAGEDRRLDVGGN